MIEELIVFFYLFIAMIGSMLAIYCIGTITHLINRLYKMIKRWKNNGH